MHSRSLSRGVVALTLLVIAGACADAPPAFEAATGSTALMRRDAEWANLATAGKEIDSIVSYWSDGGRRLEVHG